jgi:deoxyadenosine/deoxycytidine kinase
VPSRTKKNPPPAAPPRRGPRLVAIEGVIGVGKTTLTQELARRLNGRAVLEEFEDNPFLADFYKDRAAFAFSTQIFFLMSRFRQQEVLAQGDLFQTCTIADYLFDKDRIFALLTLEDAELALYERLFDVLRVQVPKPDLVVFLRADHEVVMGRIAERGRPYESGMDPTYIRALEDAYRRFFSTYAECPVLIIDTTLIDFRNDEHALERLVAAISSGDLSIAPRFNAEESAGQLSFPTSQRLG